jgi:hypothetical protein
MKVGREKEAREKKAAWAEKHMDREEKRARAEDKQAADAKHKDAMEAVREFIEARAKKKSRLTLKTAPSSPWP